MRRLPVNVKNDFGEVAEILFLTQVFDELLFDHSHEIYRMKELRPRSAGNEECSLANSIDFVFGSANILRPVR